MKVKNEIQSIGPAPVNHCLNILKPGLNECAILVLNKIVVHRQTDMIKPPCSDSLQITLADKAAIAFFRIVTL